MSIEPTNAGYLSSALGLLGLCAGGAWRWLSKTAPSSAAALETSAPARRIFLGMPGYGKQTADAGRSFWKACADMTGVTNDYRQGSLLASNFNQLWCSALNMVLKGERIDYFAMLHDDIGAERFWLDSLIDELEAKKLDVLGVAVPIKDRRGMTSLALHGEDNWLPHARLSMHDVYELPETFTSDDLGHPLLLNTGCWVCKFDYEWAKEVNFTINDRIVFNDACNRWQAQTEPEDWYFSRLLHEIGHGPFSHLRPLRIGATRKIQVLHRGETDYHNTSAWGSHKFDSEAIGVSPVPGAFPREIPGWLKPAEGKALAELASGKWVLEIGSYCGLSTVCIGRTAEHVTAVDYFDGRGTPVPRDTRSIFDDSIRRYGLTERVLTKHPDDELPTNYFDVAFIDGAHDEYSVRSDVEKAIAALKSNGLLVFHDYNEPAHPGVDAAVHDLLANGGELLSVTDNLAVVKPPALIPQEV